MKTWISEKSWYIHVDNFVHCDEAQFDNLWELHNLFEIHKVRMFGKFVPIPRKQGLFSDNSTIVYKYKKSFLTIGSQHNNLEKI